MFYITEILFRQHGGRLGLAWVAGTVGIAKIKPISKITNIEMVELWDLREYITSNSLVPQERFSLRLAAILLNGTAKIYSRQVELFVIDAFKFMRNIARPPKELLPPAAQKPPKKRRKINNRDETDQVEEVPLPRSSTALPAEIIIEARPVSQPKGREAILPALIAREKVTSPDIEAILLNGEPISVRQDQDLFEEEIMTEPPPPPPRGLSSSPSSTPESQAVAVRQEIVTAQIHAPRTPLTRRRSVAVAELPQEEMEIVTDEAPPQIIDQVETPPVEAPPCSDISEQIRSPPIDETPRVINPQRKRAVKDAPRLKKDAGLYSGTGRYKDKKPEPDAKPLNQLPLDYLPKIHVKHISFQESLKNLYTFQVDEQLRADPTRTISPAIDPINPTAQSTPLFPTIAEETLIPIIQEPSPNGGVQEDGIYPATTPVVSELVDSPSQVRAELEEAEDRPSKMARMNEHSVQAGHLLMHQSTLHATMPSGQDLTSVTTLPQPVEVTDVAQLPDDEPSERHQSELGIIERVRLEEGPFTLEDLTELPFTKKRIAKCFFICLDLAARGYLKLEGDETEDNALRYIRKGPKLS